METHRRESRWCIAIFRCNCRVSCVRRSIDREKHIRYVFHSMTLASKPSGVPAVERVVAGLADLVVGDLTPGAQLPSEADLAETYGVSRLTVREAVRVLAGRGLLELSRGRRATVREPDGSAFGDFLAAAMRHDTKGLFDLIEVRQAL